MKCYFAGSGNSCDHSYVEACFANTAKEAKTFMWKNSFWLSDACDGDYMDLRVSRKKEHDGLFDSTNSVPYLIKEDKVLRQIGWHVEGDDICGRCELAAMDGAFPVCEECYSCTECGHEDACKNQ